ncbi:MAG: hypothetical protein WA964_18100 [Ilumatobacter sp.]|uniref:hypothetical protein n=1 Tax=Ilumatobacter sp. TaxID=1967498 RepID=UPI003C751400
MTDASAEQVDRHDARQDSARAGGRTATLEWFDGRFDVGDGVVVWASPTTPEQIAPSR